MPKDTGRRWRLIPTIIGFSLVLGIIFTSQLLTQKNKVARTILRRKDPFPGAKRLRENVADKRDDA